MSPLFFTTLSSFFLVPVHLSKRSPLPEVPGSSQQQMTLIGQLSFGYWMEQLVVASMQVGDVIRVSGGWGHVCGLKLRGGWWLSFGVGWATRMGRAASYALQSDGATCLALQSSLVLRGSWGSTTGWMLWLGNVTGWALQWLLSLMFPLAGHNVSEGPQAGFHCQMGPHLVLLQGRAEAFLP